MAKQKKYKDPSETPLMKQYNQIKAKHPGALLLFRVGDFYETFGEDAVKASRILGIVLTRRKNGTASEVELAGFPHHSLDTYLPKLVRAGERVAICDQLEDPKMTKTIVKRGVTELVTPGVSLNDQVLEQKNNNFLCALQIGKTMWGVAFLDVSTGEFLVGEGKADYIQKLIQGFQPSEVLFSKGKANEYREVFGDRHYTYRLEDWVFSSDYANESLNAHFGTTSLKGFGIEQLEGAVVAAGAVLHYLAETQHKQVSHITTLARIEEDKYVWLDKFTIRNLELVYSPHEDSVTLLDILDHTLTPMGGRMLKRWMVLPLKELSAINERLECVAYFHSESEKRGALREILTEIGDLERLIGKMAAGRVNPKEINQLKRTLELIGPIRELLDKNGCKPLEKLVAGLDPCAELIALIEKTIHADPGGQIGKGKVIADGYHAELDELRSIAFSGKGYLEKIQNRESERTGIPSLKVAFNNVFGYYLEVRNTHKDKVPEDWTRKQTLVNAERYVTAELKEYESKILGAEERIYQIESELFSAFLLEMARFIVPVQQNAVLLARLDCLAGFAEVATRNRYKRPQLDDSLKIRITDGRHPVIEKQLKPGQQYVSNSIELDSDGQQIVMITGPNMSGKSALLRQTALICLMAQFGSFVPAAKAELGIVDKVFTRVGASDNISSGESTFMVEMNETSSILNNLSERSLVLLDEIGRGTSTYDGISIAWAIAEYIHEHPKARAKTLFATHYHELNEMAGYFPRIRNYNVSVKEVANKILFLRKLEEGGSEHSFGIHVAKLAGMPQQIVNKATQMLHELELSRDHQKNGKQPAKKGKGSSKVAADPTENMQLSFFQLNDPVLEQIREELVTIDINTLTPVEALMKLNEIKKLTGG